MRKLNQKDVSNLFESHGCELIGEYLGSGIPVKYRCKCGVESSISLDKFRRRLKREEGCENCNVFVWNEVYDQILKDLYGKESRKKILELIPNVSYGSVKARAKKLGLSGNKSLSMSKAHRLIKRKYSIYEDFFAKKSLNSCYWAGVLSSGVFNSLKNSVSISVSSDRRGLLERLQDESCHTGIIDDSVVGRASLRFYGVAKWILDIQKNYGSISSNPLLKKEKEMVAFVVGYLDARGSIKNFLRDYRVEFIGKKPLLVCFKGFFDKWVPPLGGEYASIGTGKRGLYNLAVWSVRAKFLIKKLWSVDVARLASAWEKFESLK